MDLQLKGKTALVTGSTKGIGKAIAKVLAQEGANVIINGRKAKVVAAAAKDVRKVAADSQVFEAPFNLADETQANQLLAAFPQVDILINNMGIFAPMKYEDIDDATWEKFFNVNVLAGNRLAKHYLKGMLAQDFGRIIFIASEEALMPSGEMPQYSMTKTMNLSLAKSLSKLTKATQVTVNTVMPGSTLTEGVQTMLDDMYAGSELSQAEKEADFMKNHRPLSQIQRLIRPEEIGRFVAFVASPEAGAFSGEALRMDGGLVPTIF